ncbi:MAG: bacterioferritin [Candidatus Eisenbacteria bacterium]|uniref:Bacterioferritin n=1 Tax=Eiseniibacteriota bacterium TaxID=2212470 RepID=A0A948RXY9_UNCEI|nr:bacterioferritin [Candidatus Eisenbacteria bacterium]MBU2691622.1 bacterioferritin [Candidatus Eisenbacteria bacterium]
MLHEQSVELLNKAVADELTAVHQYMYFHFQCDDQGYDLLAGLFKRSAIDEMLHIERIAERILFLGGDVELLANATVKKIHDVKMMLATATGLEEGAIKMYNKFALECAENADAATRKLFESLVDDEERHYNQFDDEVENLKKFGDNYLALQSIERSKSASQRPAAAE